MAEQTDTQTVQTQEAVPSVAAEDTKSKRKKVTFLKNVKLGDKRYKKGESTLVDASLADELKAAGTVE